eukprot:3424555-Rhodomonas_salina.1
MPSAERQGATLERGVLSAVRELGQPTRKAALQVEAARQRLCWRGSRSCAVGHCSVGRWDRIVGRSAGQEHSGPGCQCSESAPQWRCPSDAASRRWSWMPASMSEL